MYVRGVDHLNESPHAVQQANRAGSLYAAPAPFPARGRRYEKLSGFVEMALAHLVPARAIRSRKDFFAWKEKSPRAVSTISMKGFFKPQPAWGSSASTDYEHCQCMYQEVHKGE